MKICLLCSEKDSRLPRRNSFSLCLFSHIAYGETLRKKTNLPTETADIIVISAEGISAHAARAIAGEAARMKAHGIFLDASDTLPPQLSDALSKEGFDVFTPFFKGVPKSAIPVVEAEVSGGSIAEYLSKVSSLFPRFAVSIKKGAYDFSLPAIQKTPRELTQVELSSLISRIEPDIFFSPHLCCKYFLYPTAEDDVRLVLFDDAETISGKLRLAKKHGASHAFLVCSNISDDLADIFI